MMIAIRFTSKKKSLLPKNIIDTLEGRRATEEHSLEFPRVRAEFGDFLFLYIFAPKEFKIYIKNLLPRSTRKRVSRVAWRVYQGPARRLLRRKVPGTDTVGGAVNRRIGSGECRERGADPRG